MGKYADAYAEFTSKYDLDLNIQSEYNGAKQLASMDDFIMDTSPADKARNVYMSTLSSALTSYINKKVKFESGKSYDLSNFKLHDFITEFDKLMDAIRSDEAEEAKTEYTHRQFEGLPMDRVANEAWARVAPRFNKPLHEIWAGQIRKGSLPLEQLQNITNRSTRLLDDMVGPDRSYHSEANKDLADVIMIKNTMEEAINQRSWTSWLIPWNWGPNLRENAYLRELEGKINTYRDNKFPVDNVVPQNYAGNMLEGALGELQNTHAARNQPTQNTQTAVKSDKKQATKNKNKSAEKQDIPDQNKETAKALYQDINTVKAKFSEVIGDYTNDMFKNLSTTMAHNLVNKYTDKCWDEFNAAKNEEQKQVVLAEYSKVMFKRMYNNVVQDLNRTKTVPEKLAMAQKLTDFAMNTYSPVAFNSKYAEFGDVYYLKNTNSATVAKDINFTGSPEDVVKEIDEAKFNLGIGKNQNNKETAAALYQDINTVKAKFSEVVGDYATHGIYKNIGASMAHTVVSKCMDKCWDEFNAAKNEEQKQAVLAEHSKVMFVRMHTHVVQDLSHGKTVPEKLAMAQKLTDFAMNTYSPVAFNSKYAKYGDNYFIQNADPVADGSTLESAGSPEEIKQALTQASYELGKGKMPLPLDKEFKENPSQTSEKVQNINVPTKDKRIDM